MEKRMPVIHFKTDAAASPGHLLASWQGELEPGDRVHLAPEKPALELFLDELDFSELNLTLHAPEESAAEMTTVEPDFTDLFSPRLTVTRLKLTKDADAPGFKPWEPVEVFRFAWSAMGRIGQAVDMVAVLVIDNNARFNFSAPRYSQGRGAIGPWMTLTWWATSRRTDTTFRVPPT
jgi:hypothetical protein